MRPGPAREQQKQLTQDFQGTSRFELARRLGEGGMGVVYLAHDRDRGADVALKTLRRDSPYGILKLKDEFRALAEMVHPNLVGLHDLLEEDGTWFFTMEFIDGVDFLKYVRPRVTFDAEPTLDPKRLRRAFEQLARGVVALHDAGHLHRDIKPSNLMVERGGRLVVLDFGLVTPLDARRPREAGLTGTLEYMPPEQGDGAEPRAASDWYSVGVVLFEALTGQLPFTGKPFKIIVDKRRFEAPRASSIAPEIPPELDALCAALLRRDPDARPGDDEVLAALGITREDSAPLPHSMPADGPGLIGREKQTRALTLALTEARRGRAVMVSVPGSSGMGKSALVRSFLDPMLDRDDVMVLSGRCYERESVPYKAFDGIIDALTRRLGELMPEAVEPLVPDSVRALTRLFPVLLHIDAIADRAAPEEEPFDPREVRRRAFAALRTLFTRLADQCTPILYIDDLQWGDADSAALLAELLRPPEAPPLLVIGSYRSEEVESSDFLRASERAFAAAGEGLVRREIEIGPLDPVSAARLARSLLGERDDVWRLGTQIAGESGGNPFFIEALVRHLQHVGGLGESGLTVDDVVRARFETLDEPAQRLLQVVAVTGRPLAQDIAFEAAGTSGEAARSLGRLRAEHFVRVRGGTSQPALETYHDRIREAVTASLPTLITRAVHLDIAQALARRGAEPEVLVTHYRGAGDLAQAWSLTKESADRAAQKLAFDRAAALYADALALHRELRGAQCTPDQASTERDLLERLGRARVNAGRGTEAAEALLEAAEGAEPVRRLELTREAGAQLLISGRLKRGLEVMRGVLDQIGMTLPESSRRALPGLLARRARVRLRGTQFTRRDEAAVPRAALTRIDACWSVALGLGLIDHVRAGDFQARTLILSLEAGEPCRVARALALEAAYASATGPGGEARAGV
ncbi:MAG: protein kinase, partial [Myxococcales bacterium]|nr:protein kinase [Myxococcales bacterium]